jgi:hypothetical protein
MRFTLLLTAISLVTTDVCSATDPLAEEYGELVFSSLVSSYNKHFFYSCKIV